MLQLKKRMTSPFDPLSTVLVMLVSRARLKLRRFIFYKIYINFESTAIYTVNHGTVISCIMITTQHYPSLLVLKTL